jgi:hypothetical protein
LPRPPFAAAAAEDLRVAEETIPIETFGALVMALGTSKWVSGQLSVPPTLRRLIGDAPYQRRIIAGEFAATSTDAWRCAQCKSHHPPLDDCPPKCRGCHGHHPTDRSCGALAALESHERHERERAEAEAADRARAEALAAERGISAADANAVLREEQEATSRTLMADIKARLAASARKQAGL